MLVYAGIDEAGYGPMLGPLCIAAAAIVMRTNEPVTRAPNLWSALSGAVCRSRRDRRRRIAIDDSKRLKGARGSASTHPLKHLERAVLAFGAVERDRSEALPECDTDLFARLGATVPHRPWYESTTPLPLANTGDELRIDASRLGRALHRARIECPMLTCEAIDAEALNRQVERLGNKAQLNLQTALDLVDRIRRAWPEAHPRVVIDRQGGRVRYREPLCAAFPETDVQVVAESESVSRYRLEQGASTLTVSFVAESERRHLPVALASMTAKYVRELMMVRMNRFFTTHLPELKPTAGYVTDARRYLQDIEPVIRSLGLARESLIRSV